MYDSVEGEAALATWSAETLFGDFSLPPLVLRDGKVTTVPPFSGEETYVFPEPFGPQKVVQHIHEEIQLMTHFLGHTGLRDVDLKLGSPDVADVKALIGAGLWGNEPIEVDGVPVTPRKLMAQLLQRNQATCSYPFSGRWLDIGIPADYEKAIEEFEQNRVHYLPGEAHPK